jgi:hypothetical protein
MHGGHIFSPRPRGPLPYLDAAQDPQHRPRRCTHHPDLMFRSEPYFSSWSSEDADMGILLAAVHKASLARAHCSMDRATTAL